MVSTVDDGDGAVPPVANNSTAACTQPVNSDWFASSTPGENVGYADDVFMDTRKVFFDDTVPVEDILETEVVNYGDETQVLDDIDFVGSTATQIIDEFSEHVLYGDGEGSDTTEILGNGDELSDDDGELAGNEIQCPSYDNSKEKRPMDQTNSLPNPRLSSGSVPRFTLVRIEALRSSALAAQRNAQKDSGSGFCSKSPEQLASCDEIVKESNTGQSIDKEKDLYHGIRSEVDSSTVRRLFIVDSSAKDVSIGCTSSITGAKEITQPPTINDKLAGLSYVDSQDPGDASQADALAFVEKLIDETKTSFDDDVSLGNHCRRKSNCIPTSKGPQSLAKKTIKRSNGGKTGIFDWDDRLEDERGGDIFVRRKVDFLGCKAPGMSFTDPLKGRSNTRNACKGNTKKMEDTVCSDSKIVVRKSKLTENGKERTLRSTRKDLLDDFHEQANRNEPTGPLETDVVPDIRDVGLDTQLAADAMELLVNQDPFSDYDGCDVEKRHSVQQSPMRKCKRRATSKQFASNDGDGIGVNTRQSKKRKKNDAISANQTSLSPPKHSSNIDLERDAGPVLMTRRRVISNGVHQSISRSNKSLGAPLPRTSEPETRGLLRSRRRLRPDADECSISCDQETMKTLSSKTSESENREAIWCIQSDSLSNHKGSALRRGRSVKRQSSSEVGDHTTIACRTRKSFAVSPLAGNGPAEVNEHKGHTREEHGVDQTPPATVDEETAEALNVVRLASSKSGKPNNHISFPMKIRSALNLSEEPSDQYNLDGHMGNSRRSLRPRKDSKDVKGAKFDTSDVDKILLVEKQLPLMPEKLSKGGIQVSISASSSPVGSVTTNAASPVCISNGLGKKNLPATSLREISKLRGIEPETISEVKDARKRRDLTDIRVIFSHHLKEDVIKRQKKLLDCLKVPMASSILDATHFVTDRFVRTRNMLEAIAAGKPVVTPLWLEHVGRASHYIDEQKYILRDAKKEKEIGFNMEVSLAHARQHALLQGRKVLITENAKPSKEILCGLVKAVHGQPVERVGRSAMKDDSLMKDLLVLSCDEDYEVCVPFLERGVAAYASEVLLNGIVTRKLEYNRHMLFLDHVKRTRSTIWLRKDGEKNFTPVVKNK
ncbi:PAX-interacting protein 1 [Linum perenne]